VLLGRLITYMLW